MKFRRRSAKWALALPPKTAAKSDRRGGPRCRLRSAVRNARARPEAPARGGRGACLHGALEVSARRARTGRIIDGRGGDEKAYSLSSN